MRVRCRGGDVLASTTRNITENGAFIVTDRSDLDATGVVWVDLADPEAKGGWTNVAAIVVHRHVNGIGIMFSHPYTALARSETPAPCTGG